MVKIDMSRTFSVGHIAAAIVRPDGSMTDVPQVLPVAEIAQAPSVFQRQPGHVELSFQDVDGSLYWLLVPQSLLRFHLADGWNDRIRGLIPGTGSVWDGRGNEIASGCFKAPRYLNRGANA